MRKHRHVKPSWAYDDEQEAGRYHFGLNVIRSLTGAWARWLVPQ